MIFKQIQTRSGAGAGVGMLRGTGVLGVLVSGFLVFWFLGFKVSWFLGSKVSNIYQVSIPSFLEDIDPISRTFKNLYKADRQILSVTVFSTIFKVLDFQNVEISKIIFGTWRQLEADPGGQPGTDLEAKCNKPS